MTYEGPCGATSKCMGYCIAGVDGHSGKHIYAHNYGRNCWHKWWQFWPFVG